MSLAERDKIAQLVGSTDADRARIVTGGPSRLRGAFYSPTPLTDVPPESAILVAAVVHAHANAANA